MGGTSPDLGLLTDTNKGLDIETGCFLLLDSAKWRLESIRILKGRKSSCRVGEGYGCTHNNCSDQDAGVCAVRQHGAVSISWFVFVALASLIVSSFYIASIIFWSFLHASVF